MPTGTPIWLRRETGTAGPTAITSASVPRCSARRPASRSPARVDGARTVTGWPGLPRRRREPLDDGGKEAAQRGQDAEDRQELPAVAVLAEDHRRRGERRRTGGERRRRVEEAERARSARDEPQRGRDRAGERPG